MAIEVRDWIALGGLASVLVAGGIAYGSASSRLSALEDDVKALKVQPRTPELIKAEQCSKLSQRIVEDYGNSVAIEGAMAKLGC